MNILHGNQTPCLSCGRMIEIPGICDSCAAEEERVRKNPRTISVLELNPTIDLLNKWWTEVGFNDAESIRNEILRLRKLQGVRPPLGVKVNC